MYYRTSMRLIGWLPILGIGLLSVSLASAEENRDAAETPGTDFETVDQAGAGEEELLERITELEERLERLETLQTERAVRSLEDEIDEYLKIEGDEEEGGEEVVFTSPQRRLQELNPEISILGDFYGILTFHEEEAESEDHVENDDTHEHAEIGDGFQLKEVELSFQAPLDPYSLSKFFIGFHGDHVHAEEAYFEYTNLPGRTQLRLGKFRSNFGLLNQWHPHSYPTLYTPLFIENAFGEEGLQGVGGSLTFLLPGLWSHYNELIVEVFNGDNERAFSGAGFEKPVGLFHLKNYYDLSTATYVEFGLSGALGENDPEGDHITYLEGIDISMVWTPPQRAKYLTLELRGEACLEQRETDEGRIDTFSLFTFGDFKFSRRWTAGLQFDYIQDTLDKDHRTCALIPFLTFWQSEFVRLRFQYNGVRHPDGEWRHGLAMQSTWALGPHKHEKY